MEFELGHTYSGYKFLDVVGRSRSAVQYRVQNTLAQRVENLRTLTAAAVDDPDAEERFLREVRIRARLSHPHIVTFYTAVPIEGRMAMTTELADSLSLAERLKLGPLPWEEALDITRQLLEALGVPSPAVLRALRYHSREHPVRLRRLLQTGGFLSGPSARSGPQHRIGRAVPATRATSLPNR